MRILPLAKTFGFRSGTRQKSYTEAMQQYENAINYNYKNIGSQNHTQAVNKSLEWRLYMFSEQSACQVLFDNKFSPNSCHVLLEKSPSGQQHTSTLPLRCLLISCDSTAHSHHIRFQPERKLETAQSRLLFQKSLMID